MNSDVWVLGNTLAELFVRIKGSLGSMCDIPYGQTLL